MHETLIVLISKQLIDALESHVTMMRGTLKKKKEGDSSMKPRAASMAVEVCIHKSMT